MGWFQKKKIADLHAPSFDEIRKRTRILVIDDDVNSFPHEVLKREGYAIDYWERVRDLGKLERGDYDIIFLDIQGVAIEYSREDGLGVLEHLKKVNPGQIVVAFSAHTYDLSKSRFWKLADDSLGKPVDATAAKRVIDDLIERKRTPSYYWSLIADALAKQGLKQKEIAVVEDRIATALDGRRAAEAEAAVRDMITHADTAARIAGVVAKLSSLFF
jgi:DNA-binding NtrC family response regulator